MTASRIPTDKKTWLYQMLADEIARLIEAGTFRKAERIPSVRNLSRQKKVSISTVQQAYFLLEKKGLIEARHKSGYYVSDRRRTGLPEPEETSPRPDPTRVSVHELVMMVLQDAHNRDLVQLGPAIPSPEVFASKKLNSTTISLIRELGGQTLGYEMSPGSRELRVQIARLALNAGCDFSPDDIIITSGCTEAMDLALRAVCRPGDTVAIESPTYFGILQNLEALGLRALEIPTHPREGVSLDALRFALEHQPVRACLFVPNFNNPLGSCMPGENKKELLSLLNEFDVPLIENDISGELYFEGERPRATKSFDEQGRVILCSSFSKDLCPGFRLGWIVPGRSAEAVTRLKFSASLATATLPQLTMARFLAGGGYGHYLRRIKRAHKHNISAASRAVKLAFPKGTQVTQPSGGYLLWVKLPDTVDSLELYKAALKAGITIVPGPVFSARRQYRNFIRLNAASWSRPKEEAIARLGRIIEELSG